MSKNSQPSSRAVWIMRMLVSLLGRLAGSGYVTPASGHHSKSLHPACFQPRGRQARRDARRRRACAGT